MITRIVKMTFDLEGEDKFPGIFLGVQHKIKSFPGCIDVRLMQDHQRNNVYFTISTWESHQDLENYRQSDLFAVTWTRVKKYFVEKAEAWSLEEINP
ncbi:MAG: putative quinol monooxygenase [Cytophagaceae bacterium]